MRLVLIFIESESMCVEWFMEVRRVRLFQWLALFWFLGTALPANSTNGPGDDYKVGPGDLLRVAVFGNPDLAGDVRVSQTGNITIPLIGSVPVSGLSAREVETSLAQRLSAGRFIRDPQVTVLVIDYESQRVAVMGEVARPGQYPLAGLRRVLNLLADAGGITSTTAGDQVILIRADGSRMQLDSVALLNGDPAQNPVLGPGDSINVPKASLFYIYGEVQRPGMYKLERNMNVTQAISAAGGLTRRGSERGTTVKRHDASGKESRTHVKGSDLIHPDDVLYVKESWF
jgi:polysaccharide export outer membrane protein